MQLSSKLMDDLPLRLKTMRRSPVKIFVTLRSAKGYYFNVDMNASSFKFELAERHGKPLFASGRYKVDKHGNITVVELNTNFEKSHAEELLCCIDRTVSLHRECHALVERHSYLLDPSGHAY